MSAGHVMLDTKVRLEKLGFAGYQRRVPGLLMPVWGTSGDYPVTHQYRPDVPREAQGRMVKYESIPEFAAGA